MIGLTAEQTYLLHIMGCAVQGQPLKALPENDAFSWSSLFWEATAQTVFPIFFDVISGIQEKFPEDFYQKCFDYTRRCIVGNMRIEHAQSQLVEVLEQGQHPYVILKGETAAAYYPKPELRQLGDVDFLIIPEQADAITAKMQALGYQHSWEPGDYHQVLAKPGAYLEMHMDVAGMPEGSARQPVSDYLASIFEESRHLQREFGAFAAPCEAHHGLILLLHMQHHVLAKGMGLRHIMDWACFVNQTAHKPFWEVRLLPLLRQIGLLHFAAVITKMSSVYLHSSCPEWAKDVDSALCQALMEDILSGGNFGHKDKNRARSLNMLPNWETEERNSGKLKLLYRTLRGSALKKNPKLEGKPIRLFFAMGGRAIRYVFLYLGGKRPNLLKAASHADTRRSIYEQLHLFESEK